MTGEDHYRTEDAEHVRLQKALRESVILRELADILNSSLDLAQILQKLVKRTTELCEVMRCAVWLLEENWTRSRFRPVTYYISKPQIAQDTQKTTWATWYRSHMPSNAPLIQRLLAEEGMLLVEDLRSEATLEVFAERFQVRSVLLIALVREGRPVGMLSLDNPGEMHLFSQDQQQLAKAIAQQATIAIDNARLYQQAQAQQRRAENLIARAQAIYHVAMMVNSGEELPAILKLATGYLVRSLQAKDGLALLLETDKNTLRPTDSAHPDFPLTSLLLENLPNVRSAVQATKPVLITAALAGEQELSWFRLLNLKSLLIVPLMAGEAPRQGTNWEVPDWPKDAPLDASEEELLSGTHCVGLIAIHYTKYKKPTPGEYAFMQDIAAQCALAIEKARLLAETSRAAELANERANTLDAVFQAMAEGISLIRPDGQIVIRNSSAARFFGIPVYSTLWLQDFLQDNPTFTPGGEPYTYESFPLTKALAGTAEVRGERILATRVDGAKRVIEMTATPLKNSDQRLTGLVTAFRDITEQVQAEQSIRLALETFLYIAETVSHSTDIHEILHTTLAKTLTTLHARRGTVHLLPTGQQVFRLSLSLGFVPEEEACWLKEQEMWLSEMDGQAFGFYEQIMSGKATLISSSHCLVQPNPFEHTMVLAAPIKHDQQILGLILLDRSHSMTSPNQPQPGFTKWDIAIVEGIAQLTGLVMEQARWQQEAIQAKASEEAMREADAMKNEFLAMTAHEFRNPLTVILARSQGALRVLRRAGNAESPGLSPNGIEEHLEIIAAQTRQLNNIVATFLDAARINQGQVPLKNEIVDLGKIVQQVIDDQAHLVENHELYCILPEEHAPYLVQGDQARLSQIIANLVENAIKYSPLGGPVTVTLSRNRSEQANEIIKICVADKGIGIPLDAQSRLFERFYRAPNATKGQTRGVGLGLYIVAHLVHIHGGTIHVESDGVLGKGSCFVITLPALENKPD
jgi:PAS domain S-box-containing protein